MHFNILQRSCWINQMRHRRGFLHDRCIPFSFTCVRDDHWQSFAERLITMVWKLGDYCINGISQKRDQGVWRCCMKFLEGISEPRNSSCSVKRTGRPATLEHNRTASAPLQEEVLVAVLISRSPKEVRTYLHVQVRLETRNPAQRNLPKQIFQTSYRWMLIPCTVKVVKERKARVKVKTKVTDPDTTAKAKVNSQSNSDTLMGIAISVVNTDTRNQIVRARTHSSIACVTSVEHMGTRELTVLLKRWHTWNLNL